MKKNTPFDLKLIYQGNEIRVTGSITPYFPGTGPSMDHAGGSPDEPREIEDLCIYGDDGVEIDDESGKIYDDIQDEILEAVEDAERDDKAEAAERRADGGRDR